MKVTALVNLHNFFVKNLTLTAKRIWIIRLKFDSVYTVNLINSDANDVIS